MRHIRAPMPLSGLVVPVSDAIPHVARAQGITEEHIGDLATLLPPQLRTVTAFYDRLTKMWRYDFGDPLSDLAHDQVSVGTWMFPPMSFLVGVLDAIRVRFDPEQQSGLLRRLADERKHDDLRAEFAPILRLDHDHQVEYEVPGSTEPGPTIDWRVSPQGCPVVLLEVKNRVRDLIEGLSRIAKGDRSPNGTLPAPEHDPALLLRDIENKMPSSSSALRGGWILTYLAQPRSHLHAAFDSLDSQRVDFIFLHNWEDQVYLLSRRGLDREYLLSLFNVQHSERLVFDA